VVVAVEAGFASAPIADPVAVLRLCGAAIDAS
jgi:hypothetical protein